MRSTEPCPGSCPDNPHNLLIEDENTGNKICDNTRCYFMIQYKDGTGSWQGDFDPTATAVNFLKPKAEEKK